MGYGARSISYETMKNCIKIESAIRGRKISAGRQKSPTYLN